MIPILKLSIMVLEIKTIFIFSIGQLLEYRTLSWCDQKYRTNSITYSKKSVKTYVSSKLILQTLSGHEKSHCCALIESSLSVMEGVWYF